MKDMGNMSLKLKLEDRVKLAILPTPIHRIKKTEKILGYQPIYFKRDDMTGLGPGGNKTRSLEYILKDAIDKNSNLIISSGSPQSNLCALTACACRKIDIPCTLVHDADKPKIFTGNALLNNILGVETHFIGNVSVEDRSRYVNKIDCEVKLEGKNPYIIKNGASTGLGAFGYINAIYELFEQNTKGKLCINEIFAPGGNGGVAAGLIYGNAMLGFPFKINIISVEDNKETLLCNIKNIINEVEAITNISFDYDFEGSSNIIDQYRGEGWARNTEESSKMVFDFARREGIFIENIYNSKVLVGLHDMIKNREVSGGVCYIHTGGFSSLFSQY